MKALTLAGLLYFDVQLNIYDFCSSDEDTDFRPVGKKSVKLPSPGTSLFSIRVGEFKSCDETFLINRHEGSDSENGARFEPAIHTLMSGTKPSFAVGYFSSG